MSPWESPWWPALCECALKGGHQEEEVRAKIKAGHAMLWPVGDGCLVIARTSDDFMLVWLCVGRNIRQWWREAERDVSAFAKSVGCVGLKLEGRKGWRRILPHWTVISDEDMVLPFANKG